MDMESISYGRPLQQLATLITMGLAILHWVGLIHAFHIYTDFQSSVLGLYILITERMTGRKELMLSFLLITLVPMAMLMTWRFLTLITMVIWTLLWHRLPMSPITIQESSNFLKTMAAPLLVMRRQS